MPYNNAQQHTIPCGNSIKRKKILNYSYPALITKGFSIYFTRFKDARFQHGCFYFQQGIIIFYKNKKGCLLQQPFGFIQKEITLLQSYPA
jgi:hypothetical protein